MLQKIKKCGLGLAVFMLGMAGQSDLLAQTASSYTFTPLTGTYADITGGTNVPSIQVDQALSTVPIGFTFTFCGTGYTQARVSSNGWLSFSLSGTNSCSSNAIAYMNSDVKPGLMPLWDDHSGAIGTATYITQGTAPNRTFIMEWKNWKWDYNASAAVVSFQVKLYETTNVIEYWYRSESGAVNNGQSAAFVGATIGICDGQATPSYLSLNNTTASPTASSTVYTDNITTKPATGQIYKFSPLPVTPTVPGCVSGTVVPANNTTTVCAGTTVLRWNRVATATGYDVYLNAGTTSPTTVVSANQADTFYSATTAVGPYKWRIVPKNAVGAATGCGDYSFTTVASVTPAVSISVAPNDTICAGAMTTFTANPVDGGSTPAYQWTRNGGAVGSGGNTYTSNSLTNRDTILVVMTAAGSGCTTSPTATSQPIVMTVLPVPAISITAGGPTTFCAGGSVRLNAPAGTGYQWVNNTPIAGAVTNSYMATINGYYKVQLTGANGCVGTSDSIKVTVHPLPVPSVNRSGDTLMTSPAYTSYQWYRGNTAIAGATTYRYTLTRDGSYSVKVRDVNNCDGTSAALPVNSLNIPGVNGRAIRIYPNPASNIVHIQGAGKVNIAMYGVDGRMVLDKKGTDHIDISGLANGVYTLYLADAQGKLITVQKLVRAAE